MAKWLWRFGREDSSLWKKVMCTKYGLSFNSLLWNGGEIKSGSQFVQSINKFFCENQRAYNIVKKGFQVVNGNEEKIRFWQEVKWDSVPLMNAFLRIFALATSKSGVIFELGSWVDSKWAWDVNLRRALFNWELDQWNCFKMCLENIKLRVGIPNALAYLMRFGEHVWAGEGFHRVPRLLSRNGLLVGIIFVPRCVDVSVAKARRASVGPPPTIFELCFNMDGFVRSSPGEAVYAIHNACQLISEKVSLARRPITIISDSKSVIAWIKDSEFGNLQLVHLVNDIRLFLKSSYSFDLRYMPRESNSMAESLAKAGSSGGRDRLEWEDV
ncbi:hypothetical protein Dsin_013561 [Dipteronia sinensis]|uniref:RNase H type-1 domain-containing protein n=1 Tax=Dipteronia sinensis TaxID=43782 RepID=A0AAE0E943_9ROSI|nr:hypothetical protein Dsin_013561 [Dipteronia sinensis]